MNVTRINYHVTKMYQVTCNMVHATSLQYATCDMLLKPATQGSQREVS